MARPLIIAGERVDGASQHTPLAPWDGRPLEPVHMAGPDQLESALAAAAEGFETTRRMEPWERSLVLENMVAGLNERFDEAVDLIRDEAGKPQRFAEGEVSRCLNTLALAADEARRSHGETVAIDGAAAGTGRSGVVERFAVGPVTAITPYNFPLNLVAHKLGPAIAAGCSFVAKPAEQTPGPALLLGELAVEAGYPAVAVNVVPCWRDAADVLVTDPRPKALSFTGSAKVGWDMKARCGKKKVLLELGGNAAGVVCADADLETAAQQLAVGAFAYAGQVCISVQRVLVQRSVLDAFTGLFLRAVAQLPTGDPADPRVVCGPMIDRANADRVQAWVQSAIDAGATLMHGGERAGNTVQPMVLGHVPHDHPLHTDEVFGPVVMIEAFDSVDDAIARVNDSAWGLQVGVFTNHIQHLYRCFHQMEVGAVLHNSVPTFRVDAMPYGGVKDSGFGREGLRYAIEALTEARLLIVRR